MKKMTHGKMSSSSIDMIDHEEIPELDTAGLRKFGLTTGSIVAVLFGLALPYLFEWPWPRWPWIVGAVLIGWALVLPASLKLVYLNWTRLGLLLNRIVSPIVLGVVFFVVVTPMGLLMRATGRNPMKKPTGTDEDSYRVASTTKDANHLERPY